MSREFIGDGGPAFPIPGAVKHYDEGSFSDADYAGMTLRDYFAAKAMQGMIADPGFNPEAEKAAKLAYAMADAMLAAREAP